MKTNGNETLGAYPNTEICKSGKLQSCWAGLKNATTRAEGVSYKNEKGTTWREKITVPLISHACLGCLALFTLVSSLGVRTPGVFFCRVLIESLQHKATTH